MIDYKNFKAPKPSTIRMIVEITIASTLVACGGAITWLALAMFS